MQALEAGSHDVGPNGQRLRLRPLRIRLPQLFLTAILLVNAAPVRAEEPAPSSPRAVPNTVSHDEAEGSANSQKALAAEKAKLEFNQGNSAYEEGNYRRAALSFERAHALSPHSAVLFNAARAWWKMGESERAADNYAAAIQRGELTSEQTLRARSALSSLRKKLGWIIVSGPQGAKVSVGHHEGAPLPLMAHLAPGEHILHVESGGRSWDQLFTVQADNPLSIVAQFEQAAPSAAVASPQESAPSARVDHKQRNWGWATLMLGATLGAGAGVTGYLTLKARDEFDTLNTGSPDTVAAAERKQNEAKLLRTVTNILALSGGAASISGLTLLLTAPKASRLSRSREVVTVTLGPAQVAMSGRF